MEDNYTIEEQSIIDTAKANGTYLKAPNGEDTKLSLKQWVQVRTSAFKEWFGDWENTPEDASKVIDENGEPEVIYHGSSQWFTTFKNSPEHHSDAPDKSIFMSNDKELSNSYISWYGESDGSLPPMAHDVYLDENDPRHKKYNWGVYKEGGIYPLFANIKRPFIADFEGKLWIDAGDGRDINQIVKDVQLSGGYDGVIAKNIKDVGITELEISELPVSNDYVAFNSNQVKSAISNIGDFSLDNDDIRFREVQDNISSFAAKYNLDQVDVRKYAESMQYDNLGGAAYAFQDIRRKLRLDNSNDSFVQFSHRFAPIKEKLYEEFGNMDKLRDEAIRNTMEERNVMEAARRRIEEETANKRGRLQEFQDMSDEQLNNEYFMAIDKDNELRVRDLVNEAARRKGYEDGDSSYQGVGAWGAPADPGYENDEARRADVEENSPDVNIEDIAKGYSPQPDDYFTHLKAYGKDTPEGMESAQAINKAINEIRITGNIPLVKAYRAVPINIDENTLRNGDWVSLSRKYVEMHGNNRLEGKYRIIEQEVPANKLWWDGNDSNEWGYDDGKDYRYKNIENNRKSNDLITRDDNGNIIPLLQRFDSYNNDIRFRFIGVKGATNLDLVEEASIRLDNLAIAREMETSGKEPGVIKLATGWERGADTKWRYEVDDLDLWMMNDTESFGNFIEKTKRLFIENGGNPDAPMTLERLFGRLSQFEVLFKEYPQLKYAQVISVDRKTEVGSYNVAADSINIVPSLGKKDAVSAFNHEIQHAIQSIEGFAQGGSPMMFSGPTEFEINLRNFNSIVGDVIKGDEYKKLGELLNSDRYSGFRESFTSDGDKEVIRVLKMWYNDSPEGSFMDNYRDTLRNGRKGSASEQYRSLSGEVEARNVQKRMSLTPKERRSSLALVTEDISRKDQAFINYTLESVASDMKYQSDEPEQIIGAINDLSGKLHTPVRLVYNINELPKESVVRKNIEAGRNVKGWFDRKSMEMIVYLPNISNISDGQQTVLHEVVAHYGLRKQFGEYFDSFLDNVYDNADADIQGKILYAMKGNPDRLREATEEYIAKLAERGFETPSEYTLWQKIKTAFTEMLLRMGICLGSKLHDRELRNILWKSYKSLTKADKLFVQPESRKQRVPEGKELIQSLMVSDKQDSAFKSAVEKGDYAKLNQLSKDGFIPSPGLLQGLNFSESTMVAVQKIFSLNLPAANAIKLVQYDSAKTERDYVLSNDL